ncbi:MAG: hypothetical protein JXN61_03315 [Sedimentisphaerales bacterium]|nr:hypothetical protein [Sedimentisphaerales bacterium]
MRIVKVVLLVVFAAGSIACGNIIFQAGGDRLVAIQNNDGGWDSPSDDGDPTNSSLKNTVGPIAMGLAHAYLQTGEAGQLAALQNAGNFLLAKTNNFSPCDGYLAVKLDSIFGGTTYTNYVKTNFYNALAAGTYNRNGAGTLYDTAGYVNLIRGERSGVNANLAAWDIGIGLFSANLVGANTSAWLSGTRAEIEELDGDAYYDVLGLAGSILGLVSAGADFDPTAGEHADASSISDLGQILASYQIAGGGFAWNSKYVIENAGNEVVQETAYSILALEALDIGGYSVSISGARSYLRSVQLGGGGWENHLGSGENSQITGEALWSIPEPSAMILLGLGVLHLLKRRTS